MICKPCAGAADKGDMNAHLDCPNRPMIVEVVVDKESGGSRIVKLKNEITTQCTCQHRQVTETVA